MLQPAWTRDDGAVTPVVGTILIMGITIAGIVAILCWGTPTIQAIQDQNALVAMTGEFDDIRLMTLDELTLQDTTRTPRVPLSDGSLSLQEGTRFAVHSVHTDTDCAFHVTGWTSAPTDQFTVDVTGCEAVTNVEVYRVTGGNVLLETTAVPGVVTVPGEDVTSGDWAVLATDGSATVAEAWIVGQDQIAWELQTSVSDLSLVLDGGALFQKDGDTLFLLRDPALHEDSFSTGDHVFWLPAYSADGYESMSGRSTTTVFLGLLGYHLRVSSTDIVQLRYDSAGGLSEGWCNSLLQRDPAGGAYAEDATYPCDGTGPGGIRSVTYALTDPALPGYPEFPFEFFHDRIHVFLQV